MAVWRSKLGGEFPREAIERQDGEHHAILRQLRAEPHNARCAECSAGDTSWASVNLGVFLCVRCADVHRSLGTHISKVKGCGGTYLWGPDEVAQMQKIGNARAAECYCGAGDSKQMSVDASKEELVDFCLKKYQHRLWAEKKSPPPVPVAEESFTQTLRDEQKPSHKQAPSRPMPISARSLTALPMKATKLANKMEEFDLESFFKILDLGVSPKADTATVTMTQSRQVEEVPDTMKSVTRLVSSDLPDLLASSEPTLKVPDPAPKPMELKRADSDAVWADWGDW